MSSKHYHAFPSFQLHSHDGNRPVPIHGMSLRDWFAGAALVGLLASGPHDCDEHGLAHDAYLHADAMLRARKETGDE